ncbi:hypothetical protein [Streptomyces sp. NPDC001380]|uniref:hypothetical protein n=1 Tax=Streptomyces sp. NPDC001380 TaxID=3364566 RepID=UPI0036C15603
MEPDPYAVLQDWLTGRPYAEGTREDYEREATAWIEHIGAKVWRASARDVSHWAAAGNPRTEAWRISCLRSFYRHAAETDPRVRNPLPRGLRPPVATLPPGRPALDATQAALFLSALDRYRGPHAERARALGYLILGMDLRAHQAVALDLDDWIHEQHRTTARITLKGGGTALREVPPPVALAVAEYLPHRRTAAPHSTPETGPLLTSGRGRRLDSYNTPTGILRTVAATHPLLTDLAPTLTSDGLAASPSPFTPPQATGTPQPSG